MKTIQNAKQKIFSINSNLTDLDKWILSELELAQKEITENMDNYSLS
jgi:isoleucyl-tRNA synthetase